MDNSILPFADFWGELERGYSSKRIVYSEAEKEEVWLLTGSNVVLLNVYALFC